MILEVESFLKNNQNITIQQADKGNVTVAMEKTELTRLTTIFMQSAQIKGLYKFIKNSNQISSIEQNRELGLLRKKASEWKTAGFFRNASNMSNEQKTRNKGRQEQYTQWITNVQNRIPNMVFTIEAHKVPIHIRNIAPKNNSITYGTAKVIANLLMETLNTQWLKLEYKDQNIYDITK